MNGEQDRQGPSLLPVSDEGAAQVETPRLRLRSIKVHELRDVRPGTELRFGDGFHLVLGKNGTGKSTLLELIAAVSTLNFRGPFFAETPFHVEATLEVGEVSLHVDIRRTFETHRFNTGVNQFLDMPPRDEADVIVRVEHGAPRCQWLRARTGEELRVFDSDPRRHAAEGMPVELMGRIDPLKLSVTVALIVGAKMAEGDGFVVRPEVRPAARWIRDHPGTGTPFDEALGALRAMVGDSLTVVRGERFRATSPWLPPTLDFVAQGEPVTCDLTRDPLMKLALGCLGYDAASIYFGPAASTNAGWAYSAPSFQFFRNGKAVRRHDQLSFGQQRLFSFAWYLACNPDVAVVDELVNGLHSEWIDWCVEALGDRQCFLTSQNPILVDAAPLESEEEIRRGIILCDAVHDAEHDRSELRWRQIDDREADLIARALQRSRLDLLSDLLHALDLW